MHRGQQRPDLQAAAAKMAALEEGGSHVNVMMAFMSRIIYTWIDIDVHRERMSRGCIAPLRQVWECSDATLHAVHCGNVMSMETGGH
jgi:hypothetical protein